VRDDAQEYGAALPVGPTGAQQVLTQRFAHIRRKRQAFLAIAFAADQDLAASPIHVTQFEGGHLTARTPRRTSNEDVPESVEFRAIRG